MMVLRKASMRLMRGLGRLAFSEANVGVKRFGRRAKAADARHQFWVGNVLHVADHGFDPFCLQFDGFALEADVERAVIADLMLLGQFFGQIFVVLGNCGDAVECASGMNRLQILGLASRS
jgi:hypothetical protein